MMQKKQPRAVVRQLEKINTELLTLTYGGIVAQLVKDSESILDANDQLDKMGFNLGGRLIDEFLAKSECKSCRSITDIAECIAKQAFPMFLGVQSEFEVLPVADDVKTKVFNLHISDNPLNDFVELPEHLQGLNYSGIIAGAIRGSLAAIHWIAKCTFLKDQLKGDEKTTIQVELIREKFKDDE